MIIGRYAFLRTVFVRLCAAAATSPILHCLSVWFWGTERLLVERPLDPQLSSSVHILVTFVLPVQLIAMLIWWFWDSYKGDPGNWLNIFSKTSVGTVVFQWGLALIVFLLFNRVIARKLVASGDSHDT